MAGLPLRVRARQARHRRHQRRTIVARMDRRWIGETSGSGSAGATGRAGLVKPASTISALWKAVGHEQGCKWVSVSLADAIHIISVAVDPRHDDLQLLS